MQVEYFERRSRRSPLTKVGELRVGSWAHVSGTALDFGRLASQFSLDEATIRDVADHRELPRAEWRDGTEYIFLRLPIESDERNTAPLLLVVTPTRCITMTGRVAFSPPQTETLLTTATDRPAGVVAAVVSHGLLMYEQRIHALAETIAQARRRLATHEVHNSDFVTFVGIEDCLNEYRSSLEGILSVLEQLQLNRRELFRLADIEALNDAALHARQLLVAISASTQTIASIQNASSTIANNVLNQRMKVLTAITILLAIPNVFYGMYGMNIALPLQHEPWAYFVIVGFTSAMILITYLVARRLHLL